MTLPPGTTRVVSFLSLLAARVQYVVPDYQRPYGWKESQCEAFFYDVLAAGCFPFRHSYFLGSIVCQRLTRGSEPLPSRLLIDGQHRIVTCLLLLAALREKLFRSASATVWTNETLKLLSRCLVNASGGNQSASGKLRLGTSQQEVLAQVLAGYGDRAPLEDSLSLNFAVLRSLVETHDERLILAGLRKLTVIAVVTRPDPKGVGPQHMFRHLSGVRQTVAVESDLGGDAEEIKNNHQEGVMRILHSRVQHGVGQGSFHSASVEVESTGGGRHRFDYVYDCGALTGSGPSPALLRSIDRIDLTRRRGLGAKPVIDALVLSHFDRDHIIGAKLLAQQFSIGRIFAPYLSPEELMLVLASQAANLAGAEIRALHSLALGGGSLFEIPVTMILPGAADDDFPSASNDNGPPAPQDREGLNDSPFPYAMTATVGAARRGVGPRLPSTENVQLGFGDRQQHSVWKFRFWNRGVDEDLLAILFDELVMCGFPIAALQDAGAADEVVDWLEISANRKLTLKAYEDAIAHYKPAWATEACGKKLANFLSIGMYSGPDEPLRWLIEYARLDAQDGYPGPTSRVLPYRDGDYDKWLHLSEHAGWLGTGDAPLGEPGVWSDFSSHYSAELPLTRTVVVPHHGAAPRSGPRFYNVGLGHKPGVSAVISVGKANNYGHPMVAVLKQIQAMRGNLQVVTEDSSLGFHEVFVLEK